MAWLLLPARDEPWVLPATLVLAVAAVLLTLVGLGVLFNLTKLVAFVLFGYWFLSFFERLSFVVIVAVIVPLVDSISVWRGPTEYVVEEQPGVFDRVSVGFRVPGEDGTANLGPPDVIFFSLFLGTAARYTLRAAWTWLAMTGLLAATLIGTVVFDVRGLPALPAVCFGFLLLNADLLCANARTAFGVKAANCSRGSALRGAATRELLKPAAFAAVGLTPTALRRRRRAGPAVFVRPRRQVLRRLLQLRRVELGAQLLSFASVSAEVRAAREVDVLERRCHLGPGRREHREIVLDLVRRLVDELLEEGRRRLEIGVLAVAPSASENFAPMLASSMQSSSAIPVAAPVVSSVVSSSVVSSSVVVGSVVSAAAAVVAPSLDSSSPPPQPPTASARAARVAASASARPCFLIMSPRLVSDRSYGSSRTATLSTCGVCGNMSTGRARRSS